MTSFWGAKGHNLTDEEEMKRSYTGITGGSLTSLRKSASVPAKRRKRAARAVAAAAPSSLSFAKTELKYVDKAVDLVSLNSTGDLVLVNGIAAGSGASEHVGREVTMRSVQINLRAQATAATGVAQIVRFLLVYDRQPNGAAPAITDILTSTTVTAPRNLDNRKRFKILWDEVCPLADRITATESGVQHVYLRFYRRLRHPIEFNATTSATVTAITTGSMYFVGIGTEASGNTDADCVGTCRIRYADA